MKHLEEHIEEFERLMISKGFDGNFLCNSNFPGKLRESLHQQLAEVSQGQTFIRPFNLTTYSLWKGEESYIKCDFKMNYDDHTGFRIDKLEAGYLRNHELKPVRTIELSPKNNEDIPTCAKVNSTIGPQKKRGFKL